MGISCHLASLMEVLEDSHMVYGQNSLMPHGNMHVNTALLDSKGELRSRDPGENTPF